MQLDHSNGCVNFRDVGEWIYTITGKYLVPEHRILRGGKLDSVELAEQIGSPDTIINLRKGPDAADKYFGADHFHFPISNDFEKYETTDPEVRRWLTNIFRCLQEEVVRYPVLFHCTSGKDRTGVVVAVLLLVLGIEREIIIEEYLLSDGEVCREWIETSLDGIGDPAKYFQRLDLEDIKAKTLVAPGTLT